MGKAARSSAASRGRARFLPRAPRLLELRGARQAPPILRRGPILAILAPDGGSPRFSRRPVRLSVVRCRVLVTSGNPVHGGCALDTAPSRGPGACPIGEN